MCLLENIFKYFLFDKSIINKISFIVAGLSLALIVYFFEYKSFIFLMCFVMAIMFFINAESILYLLILVIVLLPKINILEIPGTYVAVRAEDFALLLIAFLGVLYALLKGKLLTVPKIALPMAIFLAAAFISLIAGIYNGTIVDASLGILFFLRKIEYLVPFFLAYWMFNKKNAPYIGRILLLTLFLTAVIGVLQQLQFMGGFYLGAYVPVASERIFSTFSGPYEYCLYLALAFSYFVVEYFREEKNRLPLLFLLGAIFYFILLTAARITVVSVFISAALTAVLDKKIKALLPLLAIMLLIALMFMPFTAKSRFQAFFAEGTLPALSQIESGAAVHFEEYGGGIDESAVIRYVNWLNVLQGFSLHPLLGSGPSAFGEAVDGNYVRVLGEGGIFGVLAFAWLMYNLFLMSYKYYRQADDKLAEKYSLFMLTVLSALLISALFVDTFEASKIAMLFWLLMGVQCKINAQNRNEYA
jgi:hypothetical protein